ncbi:MAG: HAD family hydrolase [Vulcanimicrobiaceae bacterium]
MDLQAALFDLDDTLHDDSAAYHAAADEVAREIAAEHGISAVELKAAYVAQAEGFWQRLDARQLRERMETIRIGLWKTALANVGIEDEAAARASSARYVRARATRLTLFPGARELLAELRSHGVRTGLLTNGFSETHREKIAVLGLVDSFDAIFIADEVGMLKPDPLLFAHACAQLQSSPSRTVMVGDRYDRDILGAQQAGIRTIWFNIRNETLALGDRQPDFTAYDLPTIRRILLEEP